MVYEGVVYTCVVGKTDPLKEPRRVSPRWKYVCFTDNRTMFGYMGRPRVWQLQSVPVEPDSGLQARRFKILAHRYFPWAKHSLWLDAAYRLDVLPESLLPLLNGSDFVAMRHPWRNRIKDEAEAIARLGLVPPHKIWSQLAYYQSQGFDTDDNPQQAITSTGFLLRKHSDRLSEFERRWFSELQQFTHRDQMSIDFILSQMGLSVEYIPGHYRDNPYAKWHHFPDPRIGRHPYVRPPQSLCPVREMDGSANATA